MNTTQRNGIMQRWRIIQHELMPELRSEAGALTPKLEQVVHTLEWVRIEEFVSSTWGIVQHLFCKNLQGWSLGWVNQGFIFK